MPDAGGPSGEAGRRDLAAQIVEDRVTPGVMHDRVELRAVEPTDRVVPGFPDDERVRLRPLDAIAERAPETVVDLVRDV